VTGLGKKLDQPMATVAGSPSGIRPSLMRNTISIGTVPPEEIITATKKALPVVSGGGQVTSSPGISAMGVGEGYSSRIEDHPPIRRRLRMGIQALKTIDMVGSTQDVSRCWHGKIHRPCRVRCRSG
jgi:hypothetical protein